MVSDVTFAPDRGDVVWINFDPQAGHEQAGLRRAIVLSPLEYNVRTGLALLCPITSRVKGFPFEVHIPPGLPVSGVALSDQVKSLDWRVRNAQMLCRLPADALLIILRKLGTLLT